MKKIPAGRRGAAREFTILAVAVIAAGAVFLLTWSGSPLAMSGPKPAPLPAPSAPENAARTEDPRPTARLEAPPATAPAPHPDAEPALAPDATPVSLRYGTKEPVARTPGALRVMTFNLENLFDDVDDPALNGKNDDKDMTKPADHCKAAAAAIRAANPDVIALQEVESLAALTQFRDRYLADAGYAHIVSIDTGDPRGIENAVLSKFPLKDVQTWEGLPLGGTQPATFGNEKNEFAGQPIAFKRSPLRVTVVAPARDGAGAFELTLFVLHEKSGRGGGYWREKESSKTLELVREFEAAHPGAAVFVLGDCNASARDESIKIFTRGGLKDIFGDEEADRDNLNVTHASGRRIDHIFVNAAAEAELVRESKFVFAQPTRPEKYDYRTTPPPKGYSSDHFPVVVDITPPVGASGVK
ncbi:hypothetical protein BH11PLA1_BH11PLA1_19710 [soil metagenome]